MLIPQHIKAIADYINEKHPSNYAVLSPYTNQVNLLKEDISSRNVMTIHIWKSKPNQLIGSIVNASMTA